MNIIFILGSVMALVLTYKSLSHLYKVLRNFLSIYGILASDKLVLTGVKILNFKVREKDEQP